MADQWRILSVSEYNGTEFISSFEHNKYPFYGVQFHPEKNAFEWKIESIPHSAESILIQQFFSNFLVNEGKLTGRRSTCTVIPRVMTSPLNKRTLDLMLRIFGYTRILDLGQLFHKPKTPATILPEPSVSISRNQISPV